MRKTIVPLETAKSELHELGYSLRVKKLDGALVGSLYRRKTKKVTGGAVARPSRPTEQERAEHQALFAYLDQNAVADGSRVIVF
ncbi:hypothetical protein [Sphingosinicella sp. BN140058]|uniref:hypothetical protein n=1 Tax=Sphingosinicella sp. BN140058 TaxID=1892855 RepID=UPI0010119E18|nr:hypothetical protein [Sphingosinicella sp. BN140058]QAY80416.1 hypothetical protein ETR14_27640 [Sphingosinicella sp. BN140058]